MFGDDRLGVATMVNESKDRGQGARLNVDDVRIRDWTILYT